MEPTSIASAYSPPFKIVAKYFVTAISSFVILNFFLMISYSIIGGHHFQPRILAITHVATLGWISMIIFGALFQLVPVVLEIRLFSEKLAEIQYWIYLPGVIGLVYGFWFFETGGFFLASGILLNLAMFIFAFNIAATLTKVKKWNLTGFYLAAAIFYLVVTAIAGLLLVINLVQPYIKIDHLQYLTLHAHIAFIGWVSMVVMGVTYKLIPMFTLSHGFSLTNGKWAFWLINIGLLGISAVIYYKNVSLFFYIFVGLITIGIILFLFQVHIIFKKRIRKGFDIGIRFSLIAYIMLGVTTILGTFMAFGNPNSLINLTLVYGYLIMFAYLSMLIVGQMYKIVPFLVWYHKFSSKVGLEKVPMLKDMFNEKYAAYGFYLMFTAVIATVAALLLRSETGLLISFTIMFFSSIIFAFNMITIFRK